MGGPPSSRPLPTYAEEVLAALKPKVASTANGVAQETAEAYLDEEGFESSTISAALDELQNRGYIYEVNGKIRLTDGES